MGQGGQGGRACGHAEPRTGESEARHQREYALGVGPQRHKKMQGRTVDMWWQFHECY